MDLTKKLEILADAAKYDASCAVVAPARRTDPAEAVGIAQSYGADGKRIALLKILLSNHCVFDCSYCVNRRSSDVPRARFAVPEVVALTLDYHRRGLIDGLFLSSGVFGGADETMEQLVAVVRSLRREHHYFGYIHLKTIPGASAELLDEAGRWADRLSVNVELPRQADLDRLAPEKSLVQIQRSMDAIKGRIDAAAEEQREARVPFAAARYAPAGQTTQMIVGATDATDAHVLTAASSLYAAQGLRRIYYSAFVPIPGAPDGLPAVAPSTVREQRLYQADWLLRFYGFDAEELTTPAEPNLSLALDPKLAWALRNPGRFPVDVNRAPQWELLRVPGIGATGVDRILKARRQRKLALADLKKLRISLRRAEPFIVAADHRPRLLRLGARDVRDRFAPRSRQLELFPGAQTAAGGEL
ncbi:MAG TPA: putative DNA modification/repair radical SAM protein [Gemmatimonadaceae bacterium]|nr:putative DNA modification/repair radical SAM protein [Gemmatimonadaceae bacterium]